VFRGAPSRLPALNALLALLAIVLGRPAGAQHNDAQQPTGQQPSVEQPTAPQPTVRETTGQQPTVQHPTVRQPTGQQPAVQQPTAPGSDYQREVFQYTGSERPDPFRSPLPEGDLRFRFEDLTLHGVIHHAEAGLSVAILRLAGSDRRILVKVGDRLGPLRVDAVLPDRVDIVVEELGTPRRETLRLESGRTATGR
jgi:hypothetical protein